MLCPFCGNLSAYSEIDRLAALRNDTLKCLRNTKWIDILKSHKKKAFCLMCHYTIELSQCVTNYLAKLCDPEN
ncbi:hypothetical protein DPS92_23980 [Salmonella enterica subsp. enterica serovar Richmond]|uniref:hypothetical protein n=1 Tax=Salmonella enterica TaxID=28901 RepID=UPI000FB43AF6|nr:hypothetical protein [Salmonella enterica subsp. enterica serovar Richmond]EAA2047780.1 hypothetical protein [Salmonella enterica subsp. enterica serovar Chester]EAC1168475.1 hypothetical protein [Salmonella enterica subsp. enterica serovar Typhimurium]EAV3155021.1 hypothetical protein [Salmonella enterica]EBS4432295.1 hypothetical protein [Salmonella enterica subsp. enterica serovar Poona]EBY6940042.1 hypothetical protein [Salmonella enterica subsp. enterica serovar Newport]EBZ2758185.1 h